MNNIEPCFYIVCRPIIHASVSATCNYTCTISMVTSIKTQEMHSQQLPTIRLNIADIIFFAVESPLAIVSVTEHSNLTDNGVVLARPYRGPR